MKWIKITEQKPKQHQLVWAFMVGTLEPVMVEPYPAHMPDSKIILLLMEDDDTALTLDSCEQYQLLPEYLIDNGYRNSVYRDKWIAWMDYRDLPLPEKPE